MPSTPESALVTGGAGFVGAAIATSLKDRTGISSVTAFDNLRRRGAELNLGLLRERGIEFVHGDVRSRSDLEACGSPDLIVDCSAEPSVLAGTDGGQRYVLDTNLYGTINCLELARKAGSAIIFLSTSRVYPHTTLESVEYREEETRLWPELAHPSPGLSDHGVSEAYPLEGARSLYGATKLCSELLLAEYGASLDVPWVVNRCGVIAGPGQWGKVDQGVLTLWVARHVYEGNLAYIGHGGEGKQVRDMLHIEDLVDLVIAQIARLDAVSGSTFNVGGGTPNAISLRELTDLCVEATGNRIEIASVPENRQNDLPWFVTDARRVYDTMSWQPRRTVGTIVEDVTKWIRDGGDMIREVLS